MSEAKKGSPKIALNMSMVKTIMWDKGPDYTFERVKAAGLSYFELSQMPRALTLRKIWTVLLQPINVWELHM